MSRNQLISVYVSESEKKHLQTEADEAGETLSSYVYKLMQAERQRREVDQAATEHSAEERIEALVAEAREDLEEIADNVRDMNARAGAYSVANFELLKQDSPDARRKEVLETGARRLRYPLEDHADLQGQGESAPSEDVDDSNESESEGENDAEPTGVDDLL